MKRLLYAVAISACVAGAVVWVLLALSSERRPPSTDPQAAPGTELTQPEKALPREDRAGPAQPPTGVQTAAAQKRTQGLPEGDSSLVLEAVDRAGKCQGGLLLRLHGAGGHAEGLTDADGKASFPELAPGSYDLTISGEGIPELVSAREIVLLEGEAKTVVLTLGPFDLTLSGTVLDGEGRPAPKVMVHARKHLLVPQEGDLALSDPGSLQTATDSEGKFAFASLEAWEYLVYAEPTREERSPRAIARPGSKRVILKLEAPRRVQLHGQVTSAGDGSPLAGAVVKFLSPLGTQAVSDTSGAYSLQFEIGDDQPVYIFDAVAANYRNARFRLDAAELTGEPTGRSVRSAGGPSGPSTWQADIAMEPASATAVVGGTIRDDAGKPVEGLSVLLKCPTLRLSYTGKSDAQGRFSIADVPSGEHYRLSVEPGRGFKDHVEDKLQVPPEGIDLAIRLIPLQRYPLEGTLVDPAGSPIPRFTLKVTPREARASSATLTSDEAGRFQLPQAPAGDLVFESGSPQGIEIRGLNLDEVATDVTLVLDVGQHRLAGAVVDENGVPLPGVQLAVQWSNAAHGLRSSSLRRTRTDLAGEFALAGIGPGSHRVSASRPGFIPALVTCDVGGAEPRTVIQLRRKAGGKGE